MRRIRRAAKTTFVGCLAVVLYAIATNSGSGWMYVISAGIGAVLGISVFTSLFGLRGLEVSRRAPLIGHAGEPLRCEVEFRNAGRFPRHLLEVRDGFASGTGGAVVSRVKGGETARLAYTIESPRRGVYSGGEILVESGAPFGLFFRRRLFRVPSSTVIQPSTFAVADLPTPATRDTSAGDEVETAEPHRGLGGEFWGVREYRPGDPARLIAWRSSAHSLATGRLAIVELSRESAPPLSVSLDLDRHAPRLAREMIISAAASLLLRAVEEGRGVTAGAGPENSPFPESPDDDAILTWCAGLKAGPPANTEGADVEILPSLMDIRPTGRGVVVLVSCHAFAGLGPWMTPDEERAFVESMEKSGRRVAVLGPDVAEPWRLV
jgi:uncharacterized protein (DUF58 family)